jgi:hypothetical protein
VGSIDAATWQALGVLLTILGLVLSAVVWKRRGRVAGLRGVAWSLLPAAAGLTGTIKLLWEIGDNIVNWAVHLVFSPVVWMGVALAGVSLMLFALTGALRARAADPAPAARGRDKALPRDRSAKPAERRKPAVQDEDMDEIEAILRKHGIS